MPGTPPNWKRNPIARNFCGSGRPPAKTSRGNNSWLVQPLVHSYVHCSKPWRKRARAPNKIEPAKQVEPTVLEAFLRSTEAARALVRQASNYDVNRIRYKNPFIPLLRFTVGTGLEIIAKHEGRHLLQAEAVRQSAGFPQ